MQRRSRPLTALAVVVALLLGACSTGGDDDAAADSTTTTTEAPGNEGDDTTTTEGDDGPEAETTTTEGGRSDGPVDVGADGQAYVDALVASMEGDDDFPLADGQAECFSSRLVDTIGVDRLRAAGITPEMMADDDDSSLEFTELGLSEAEGNKIYDGFGDCGVDVRAAMLASFAEDEDMTPAIQACLEGVFTDQNLRTLMVFTMISGDDALENNAAVAPIMGGMMGCAFMGMGDMGGIDFEDEATD